MWTASWTMLLCTGDSKLSVALLDCLPTCADMVGERAVVAKRLIQPAQEGSAQ